MTAPKVLISDKLSEAAVQIFRDNEDRVHELWACGQTASGWEDDRYDEQIQEELEAIERDRYEHQPFSGCSDLSPLFLLRDRERDSDSDESQQEANS